LTSEFCASCTFWKIRASIKKTPQTGDKIVILGWRKIIESGGAAVSSADTSAAFG
jgi:phosphoribosylformylglycinamidine synthase